MTVRPLLASLCASLDDFLAKPLDIVDLSGASAVAILDANQPVFYVVSPDFWKRVVKRESKKHRNDTSQSADDPDEPELEEEPVSAPRASRTPVQRADVAESVLTRGRCA